MTPTILCCSEEDAGIVLDEYIGPGLQLMEQSLGIAERTIKLIVPRSSDAVLNFYIEARKPAFNLSGIGSYDLV